MPQLDLLVCRGAPMSTAPNELKIGSPCLVWPGGTGGKGSRIAMDPYWDCYHLRLLYSACNLSVFCSHERASMAFLYPIMSGVLPIEPRDIAAMPCGYLCTAFGPFFLSESHRKTQKK